MKVKKLFAIALAALMIFSVSAVTVFAGDQSIDGQGHIGVLNEGETDSDKFLNVTIPTSFSWYVTPDSDGIQSPDFGITNNVKTIDGKDYNTKLEVTMKSFTQTNTLVTLNLSALELYFTGALAASPVGAAQNLNNGFTNTVAYAATLDTGATWTFGFAGDYNAPFPIAALVPTYKMLLNFNVVEVTAL